MLYGEGSPEPFSIAVCNRKQLQEQHGNVVKISCTFTEILGAFITFFKGRKT